MTDKHPITPPPELVKQWDREAVTAPMAEQSYIATQAARWGADQELDECCKWLLVNSWKTLDNRLRAARRSKPPSLKDQALAIVENLGICDHLSPENERIIRRALEQLDD